MSIISAAQQAKINAEKAEGAAVIAAVTADAADRDNRQDRHGKQKPSYWVNPRHGQ